MSADDIELSPTASIIVMVVVVVVLVVAGFWLTRPKAASALAELQGAAEIQATGMTGTFDHFDVIGNVPFATTVAQHWKADAVLARVHALEVQRSGAIDTTGSGKDYNSVAYTFIAPSDSQAALKLAFYRGSIHAEILERNGVSVPPPRVLGCDSAKLAEIVRNALNVPLYSIDLDYYSVGDAGGREWRWVAVDDADEERKVRVCAATCTLQNGACTMP